MLAGLALGALEALFSIYLGIYILAAVFVVYGFLQIITASMHSKGKINGTVEIIYNIKNMPEIMQKLAWVQMLAWFGLFAMFIYCTQAVTSYHFNNTDPTTKIYNDGADWVGVLMAVYNGVAAIIAFMIPGIAKKIGRVKHMLFVWALEDWD